MISPYSLGATMYVPATINDLLKVINGQKYSQFTSIVICTEDAVTDKELSFALSNLKASLLELSSSNIQLFIRPRNIVVAQEIIRTCNLAAIKGMVLPKFTLDNMNAWANTLMLAPHLLWMPTLEDESVFEVSKMQTLAEKLLSLYKDKVLMIRIGGNDLFKCLGLRRPRGVTIYETPLGYTLKMLSTIFLSKGIKLSSPVFEHITDIDTLGKELEQDLNHGFVSKTAIHPSQVEIINSALKVSPMELSEAESIISAEQAVFKLNNSMAEPSTHKAWAINTLERAESLGAVGTVENKSVMVLVG